MNSHLWKLLNWFKHHSHVAAAMSLRYRGALRQQGWFESVRKVAPVDATGAPIPWISYPALHFVSTQVRPDMNVLEFGSGNSTLWWASRVHRVLACETDSEWYGQIQQRAPANVEIVLGNTTEHCELVARQPGSFDIVVIDGGDRATASEAAPSALTPGGVILWDDTDRAEYKPAMDRLTNHGFRRLPFGGLGPVINLTKETSVFYRPNNVFGI